MAINQARDAVFAAQEALRTGRHLLVTTANQLLGGLIYDKNTPIGRALAEMEAAEKQLRIAAQEMCK